MICNPEQNDFTGDAPTGNVSDNNYTSRTGQSQIPVRKDDAPVEDPIDSATADSDETLVRDENEAIDQSNIIEGCTRGATKASTYAELDDEEGLSGPNDGISAVRR